MDYRYDIRNFYWNKELNTFFADAWDLNCYNQDGSMHPEAFPNGKEQFYIDNPETKGFRRFTFVKEQLDKFHQIDSEGELINFEFTNWIFESEDGILCSICIGE